MTVSSKPSHFFLGVTNLTANRLTEFQSLVQGDSPQYKELQSPASNRVNRIRRPVPIAQTPIKGATAAFINYASADELCSAVRLFSSRGFSTVPFYQMEDEDATVFWKWHIIRLDAPLPEISTVQERLAAPEYHDKCLLIPCLANQTVECIACLEFGKTSLDIRQRILSKLQSDIKVLKIDSSFENLENHSRQDGQDFILMMMKAFEAREAANSGRTTLPTFSNLIYNAPDLLKYRVVKKEDSISNAAIELPIKLVEAKSQHRSKGETSIEWAASSNEMPLPNPAEKASLGGPSSFSADLGAMFGQSPPEIAAKLAAVICPERRFNHGKVTASQDSFEDLENYVRRLTMAPAGGVLDKATTIARILDLIREMPFREVPLAQLPGLFASRHRVPLNPIALGHPTLKSYILSVPELCLVWVYEPPPSAELSALRHVLRLDEPSIRNIETHGAISKLQILLHTDSTDDNASCDQVLVQERSPSVAVVGRDVLVAVVAHWVMIHESQDGYRRSKSLSAALGTVSPIGMSLSLLARTWEANWSSICPLSSLLRRSKFNDLQSFVQSITQFVVKEEPAQPQPPPDRSSSYFQESNIIIYLKRSARIPIIPELVPDPTTAAFSAPIEPGSGSSKNTAALVFFPPLLQPQAEVPPPPPPKTKRRASTTDIAHRGIRARTETDSQKNTSKWNQVLEMIFELIAVNCEWQRLLWEKGEDLIEMREQAEDAASEHEENHGADETTEKLRKKEEREERRRKRTALRELCRTKREDEHEEGLNAEGLDAFLKTMTAEELAEKRQQYRNSCIGVFVSSVKMEWSKYFEDCYPLTYYMEYFRVKKLKQLLCDIPNLILTGDGGFMRVCTIEHAKLMCSPYPPEGLSADGHQTIPCQFTSARHDIRFCCSTYIAVIPEAERRDIRKKSLFAQRLNLSNINSHRRPSLSQLSCGQQRQRRSVNGPFLSLTAVWEMPRNKAIDAVGVMLVDLVRYCCSRQRDEATKSDILEKEHEEIELALESKNDLTPAQEKAFEACRGLGIDGLKLTDVPNRWNYSFVLFSPFTSFVKKAGIENIGDKNFINLVQSLNRDIFLIVTKDGTQLLLPVTLEFLSDPQYFRPPETSSGVWMKRKSIAYLSSDYNSRRMSGGSTALIQPGFPVMEINTSQKVKT